jgi:ABC-2 type transport system permease protein
VKALLDAATGIVVRDARLGFAHRAAGILAVLTALFSLAVFFYVAQLVGTRRFPTPEAYFAFVVVGIAGIGVVTAALASAPQELRTELVAGTFERLVVTPFGAVRAIAAMTVWPIVRGLVLAVATLLLAATVFGLPLAWGTLPLALPIALLGALAFVPLALLVCAVVLVLKQVGALTGYLVTGLALTSGALFPTELLPWWLRWIAEVQPLAPALDLLRHVAVDAPLRDPAALELARLAAFALVGTPLALWVLHRAVERGKLRGTLTEA